MNLDTLPLNASARITAINWSAIPESEGHRLRSLGLDVGVVIQPMHRGILFWKDPIAVRVGRMTVALRRKVAAVVDCELVT